MVIKNNTIEPCGEAVYRSLTKAGLIVSLDA